jgi:hypothetical protein
MDLKSPGELQDHMLGTYGALRVMLTVVAVSLPITVFLSGWFQKGEPWLASSISKYYWAPTRFALLTPRDFFVGGLLAAAVCLYAYKGFSTRENVALNFAGVFAFFVAILPTNPDGQPKSLRTILHATSAVLFFLCIAYVSIRRSRDTLRLLDPSKRERYARMYFVTGLAMIISPVWALVLSLIRFREEPRSTLVFWIETCGVVAFALYWWVKTLEMRETKAEDRGLDGGLERKDVAPIAAGVPDDRPLGPVDRAIRGVMVAGQPAERVVPATSPAPRKTGKEGSASRN